MFKEVLFFQSITLKKRLKICNDESLYIKGYVVTMRSRGEDLGGGAGTAHQVCHLV